MTLADALLALMLTMPAPHGSQESTEARAFRLSTIARSIVDETASNTGWLPSWNHLDRAALVAVVTYHESGRWSRGVHVGSVRGDNGRSICLGQIMSGPWIDADWWASLAGEGLEATKRCIRQVTAYLSRSRRRCASGLGPTAKAAAGTYALYGTGYSCGPFEFSRTRGNHFERMRWQLMKKRLEE